MGIERLTFDEVIEAWPTQHEEQYGKHPPEVVRNSMPVTDAMLRLLANGKPVSDSEFKDTQSVNDLLEIFT